MAGADSLFFKRPKVGFGTRSNYYSATYRTDAAHEFINQKIAYATAACNGAALSVSTAGGIGDKGMYHGRYKLPDAHITSVKVSNEGDFGSLRKAEVSFVVYDAAELKTGSGFLSIGATLTVSYGWSAAGGAGGSGEFSGTTYNFSYSVNADGSFNCTTYAIGKGVATLGFSSKTATDANKTITDPNDIVIKDNSMVEYIRASIEEAALEPGTSNGNIAAVEIPEALTKEPDQSSEEAAEVDLSKKIVKNYVTLEFVINTINEKIIKSTVGSRYSYLKINTGTYDSTNQHPAKVGSANPLEMLTPGNSKDYYGTNLNFTINGARGVAKIGDVYISMDSLESAYATLTQGGGEHEKSKQDSIFYLLNNIFDMIYRNSGGLYRPYISTDHDNKWHLVDGNYFPNSVEPLVIPAMSKNSVVRSISLQSALTSEYATAAFIGGASTATRWSTDALAEVFPGAEGEAIKVKDATEAVDLACTNMDKGGVTVENVTSLEAAMRKAALAVQNSQKQLIPLELSVTVDGIEGFEFGDAITTNYLPSGYFGKVAFVVTRVDHNISGGDWTTTLSTACRVL